MKFIKSKYVQNMCKVLLQAYRNGWDERNGGNMSMFVPEKEIQKYDDILKNGRNFDLGFDAAKVADKYFLVTATGQYFRNVFDHTERDLGLIKISSDGKSGSIIWGYNEGAMPTSEFPTHLMSHIARMEQGFKSSVVMHSHLTNLIAMTFTQPLSERYFTRTIWKMQSESLIILPEGVAIIPYMVPGTVEIGEATAKKVEDKFRVVIWPHHGAFAAGQTSDECFGLLETVEKAAEIFSIIQMQGGNRLQEISENDLKGIAKHFGLKPRKKFL